MKHNVKLAIRHVGWDDNPSFYADGDATGSPA